MKENEVLKKHILKTASECFNNNGFHETSLQDIANAAGISKGGLYYYFPSKEKILFQLHDNVLNVSIEKLKEVIYSDLSLNKKIKSTITNHLLIISNFQTDIRLLYREIDSLSFELREQIQSKKNEYDHLFRKPFFEVLSDNKFDEEEKKLLFLYIKGALDWTYIWWDSNKDIPFEKLCDYFSQLTDLILQSK
ncbi:TetR/AcrR family transcriptional regulator [Peribacillus aracenensis]|uniref:TetR/AcrR family transcriptional regulator n=1 Tax=Peribacillus aracenensis TaxID=2976708 RepID=UPI0021A5BA3E|nr:TetR/AcrR family transcriptional regulator [Peribacillus sp. BBB004]